MGDLQWIFEPKFQKVPHFLDKISAWETSSGFSNRNSKKFPTFWIKFEVKWHKLPIRLVYGSYPDVVCSPGSEREVLNNLTDSYLYKDILIWERIKRPDKIVRLLQALAYQVGSEVSTNELSRMVELDRATVEKYINLLEQAQVVFRLGVFSRKLRTEIKSSRKIYFYDNGIRNALIGNLSPVDVRPDIGAFYRPILMWKFRPLRRRITWIFCKGS